VLAVFSTSMTVSFASLVFRGDLSDDLGRGVALALTGAVVLGTFVALRSGLPGHLAGPQDATAVVLGIVAADLVESGASTDTVIAYALVATAASALLLALLGLANLGGIARIVPFPVTGGFIAGTGLVMLTSTADLLRPADGDWLTRDAVAVWVPAVLLGAALAIAARVRRLPAWTTPTLLAIALIGFHAVRGLAGVTTDEAAARSWTLPDVGRFELRVEALSAVDADWSAIARHLPELGVLLVLVSVSQLFRFTSVEVETGRDLDVDRELRQLGLGGALSVPVGGLPGYTVLSQTLMLQRLVGPDRGVAVAVALVPLVLLAIGGGLLALVPLFVTGAVLVYLGLGFVIDWTWSARHRLPPADLAMLAAIALAIGVVGFLPGVALGMVVALGLFVVRYSRIDVVRRRLTGVARRSTVERSAADEAMLDRHGGAIEILELQGYLFFGTAGRLVQPLRERDADGHLLVLVLDFRRVTGLDSSAVVAFERIGRLGRELDLAVIIGGYRPDLTRQLVHLRERAAGALLLEPDIDRALQQAEDLLLAFVRPEGGPGVAAPTEPHGATGRGLVDHGRGEGADDADGRAEVLARLPATSVPAGTVLLEQGRDHGAVYLLDEGSVSVLIESMDGTSSLRRRRVTAPAVLGEIGYYLDRPPSATVVAETECTVRVLDRDVMSELSAADPRLAADIHLAFARSLAQRLVHSDQVIRQLAE
jgi:sulfate permease, SulP family